MFYPCAAADTSGNFNKEEGNRAFPLLFLFPAKDKVGSFYARVTCPYMTLLCTTILSNIRLRLVAHIAVSTGYHFCH